VASFVEIMASKPTVYKDTTLASLMSGGQALAAGYGLYQSTSNLVGSWNGSGQQAQTGQATGLLSSGQQIMTALTQTQSTINAGAQQMQAAKTRLLAMVKAAKAEGFLVSPAGMVTFSPQQHAAMNTHHYLRVPYHARLAFHNAQINAVVMQTTMADVMVGLSLAKTGVDILSAFTKKDAAAPAVPVTPPGTATPVVPIAPPTSSIAGTGGLGAGQLTGTSADGVSGLAGVGELHGAFGGGPGGIGGGIGLGGAGMTGAGAGIGLGPGGVAGLGPGLAGAGRTAVPVGGAAGRGSAAGNTVMGMGGAGAGHGAAGEEREAEGWLLTEDGDPWAPDDLPDTSEGVLS
jgi:uncharacterized protein YukE